MNSEQSVPLSIWICNNTDTIIAGATAIISCISAIIAWLTYKNTSSIKTIVNNTIIQESFVADRKELEKLLNKCLKIVQDGTVRPANSAEFNTMMSRILSSMDRYLSLGKESRDQSTFASTRSELETLLSERSVENIGADIAKNAGYYGRLIGNLDDLLKNGRPENV